MPARTITIDAADGSGSFAAYLSVPAAGGGPGLLLAQEIFGINATMRAVADGFAEEGYVCLVPDLFWRMQPGIELGYGEADFEKAFGFYQRFDVDKGVDDLGQALAGLRARAECSGGAGVMGFCLGGKLAYLVATRHDPDIAVAFYGVAIEQSLDEADRLDCPILFHFAGRDQFVPPEAVQRVRDAVGGRPGVEIFEYPEVDHAFYNRDRDDVFHRPSAMMAHSRSIAALRKVLGPDYDLNALWEAHLGHEFVGRDPDATMATMVAEPYVNHVPVMTGGVGYAELHRFYKNHFIPKTPKDTRLVPVSRTVGADRVIDEMLFCFTHDEEIDWMLPGVAPTGKYVEIPLVAIVNFRGDKLYHEHIYWDQASVLVQIGLLDPAGLPVAGRASAAKLVDESQPSNELMARWAESAGD